MDNTLINNQWTSKWLCHCRNKDYLMKGMRNPKKFSPKKIGKKKIRFILESQREIGYSGSVIVNTHVPAYCLRYQTPQSQWFWRLTLTQQINLIFLKKSSAPWSFNSRCTLCLEETISIIRYRFTCQRLNKHWELNLKCQHKNSVNS